MKKTLDIGNKLSDNEQKGILGAAGCSSGGCSVYSSNADYTYYGSCGWYTIGAGYGVCECITNYGYYETASGVSSCWSN